MFNAKRVGQYYLRLLIVAFIAGMGLFILSLAAVSLATRYYNWPIVPHCPESLAGERLVTAFDSNGVVVNAALSHKRASETLEAAALSTAGVETEDKSYFFLSDIVPATTVGGQFTARLNVLDTAPEGYHDLTLTFSNNDVPIAQTAQCFLTIRVTKVQNLDGTKTIATIQEVKNPKDPFQTYFQLFGLRIFGGILPGVGGIITALLLVAVFITALYRLESLREGVQFLIYRIFGRPGFAPYLIIQGGKILLGKDSVKKIGGPAGLVIRLDSAVVTEKGGKLARVLRGPGFPRLAPFEKIWDIIDLRPQRWSFKVSAITQDGIPITYEVAIKYKVINDDESVLKATACKWIREAWRTEPDRLMSWDKRVILGATEGTMRTKILAQYKLDELLDVNVRRQIRQALLEALTISTRDFGVEIMDVTLHDIEFQGQVLEEWAKTWRTRRDIEVQKIEADERVQELKMRERAVNQVRHEMLDRLVGTLTTMTEEQGLDRVSADYVLLGFIDMIEHTAAAQRVFIPEDSLLRFDRIKKELR